MLFLVVILYYDWIHTLEEEIRHVWFAPKTMGVWLFFLNRYFSFLAVRTSISRGYTDSMSC